jgi:hypothetical protein
LQTAPNLSELVRLHFPTYSYLLVDQPLEIVLDFAHAFSVSIDNLLKE